MEKLTIIKVLSHDDKPSQTDIERWGNMFRDAEAIAANAELIKEATANGEIVVDKINVANDPNYYHMITLVKVGDEKYTPSSKDLEDWVNIFKQVENDPDYTIITHSAITIDIVPYSNFTVLAVE